MRRQVFCDISQSGIGHESNLFDVLVMIFHEAEVGRHRSKTFPAGKRMGLDDEAGEPTCFFNLGVDRSCELNKVALLERGFRP